MVLFADESMGRMGVLPDRGMSGGRAGEGDGVLSSRRRLACGVDTEMLLMRIDKALLGDGWYFRNPPSMFAALF